MKWFRQHVLMVTSAHPDYCGDGYNNDIARAARCADMTLDDGLSRGGGSQMQARQ
jgi:hypothetical protein